MQRAPAAGGINASRRARVAAQLGPDPGHITQDHRGRKPGLRKRRVLVQHPRRLTDLQVDARAQEPDDVLRDRGVAGLDPADQRHPAWLAELACHRQLGAREGQRGRNRGQPAQRASVAGTGGTPKLLGLAPGLIEIRVLRKCRHDISFTARWSACQATRRDMSAADRSLLTRSRGVSSRMPGFRMARVTGLLERENDLEMLAAVVDRAIAGTGCAVFVGGDAGIGKTSLVRELRERVGDRVSYLMGACEPLSVPVPLAPLRELAEAAGAGDLAELGSDDKLVLTRALVGALERRAPVVAVVEDVHWADPLTLDLVRLLARRVEGMPVVLVLTLRDDEVAANRRLELLLGDLASAPAVRRIALRPLSDRAIRELAGSSGVDVAELARATGGNPFLVVEAIAAGGRLPASVRDASLARAGRLSATGRAVVDAAAVIGLRFEPPLLESLVPDSSVAVEEALARGVLVADGGQLGFRHELIREALESCIAPPRRAALHARVFSALREQPAPPENARLAHHAELGGLAAEACRYAIAAADEAERIGAMRETRLQAGRALRFGAELAPEQRFELLLRYALAGDFSDTRFEEAVSAAERAVAVAAELDDPVRQGRALVTLAWPLWSSERVAEAKAAVERAIAVLEPTGDIEAFARAHATLLRMEATAFDPRAVIETAPRALALAENAALDELRIDVAISVGLARGHRGQPDAPSVLLDALGAAQRAGLTIQIVRAYVNLTVVAVALRDHALVDRIRSEALPLFEAFQTPLPGIAIEAFRARSLLDRGRWDEAQEILGRGGSMWQGEWPVARAFVALIGTRRGDPRAAAEIEQAWDRLGEMVTVESSRHGMVRLALVEAAWLAGDDALALERLRAAQASEATGRFARSGGELALWASRYGMEFAPPAGAPQPVELELAGDWRGAIRAWRELEAPYEAALAALPGDDRAAREALGTLHRLGANGAARAFTRERAQRGARTSRGPRRSTLANPAGLTRREQEVLDQLATGATNAAIAGELHLSERTVAHHVSAILAKLNAKNRMTAVERARARGLLAKDRHPVKPR
jgi:DNA-binding CsgD family transcriptional regulator